MDDKQVPIEQRGVVLPDDYLAIVANVPVIAETREAFIRTLPQRATAAEVGVAQGGFSIRLVQCNPKKLYLIDGWDMLGGRKEETDNDELICRTYFKPFENVEIIKTTSYGATKIFTDESLDWIYLDANHDEQSVYIDLCTWQPKIKMGGYIIGHDFCFTGTWGYGVVPGVFRFAKETFSMKLIGQTRYTGEEFPSFIMQKVQ